MAVLLVLAVLHSALPRVITTVRWVAPEGSLTTFYVPYVCRGTCMNPPDGYEPVVDADQIPVVFRHESACPIKQGATCEESFSMLWSLGAKKSLFLIAVDPLGTSVPSNALGQMRSADQRQVLEMLTPATGRQRGKFVLQAPTLVDWQIID